MADNANQIPGVSNTAAIITTLKKHPNIEKAVLFGSRAKGNFTDASDIDIALFGEITKFEAEHIRSDLEELPIIQKFDVIAYHEIKNPRLKSHIDRAGIVLYQTTIGDEDWEIPVIELGGRLSQEGVAAYIKRGLSRSL